ncbi:MAG: hypothetical protein ACK5ME_02360 [Parahaliea sp.]
MNAYFVVESHITTGLFVFGRIHFAGERATHPLALHSMRQAALLRLA